MAGINLKYSRRLDALVLKPGKHDTVSYRLVAQLREVSHAGLLRIQQEDTQRAEPFYYGVAGLSKLEAFIGRPISLVQYRMLLESLLDVMELCVRESLPQGNICFDPACVFTDERGAMRFAFVPFERVDGMCTPLDLLTYLGGRKVRMVLPQDEAVQMAVADFARSRSVLPAADFAAFLAERFGGRFLTCVAGVSGSGAGSGSLDGTGSTGATGVTGSTDATRAAGTHVVTGGSSARGVRVGAALVRPTAPCGAAVVPRRPMTVNPVAMMTDGAKERQVAYGVAASVGGAADSGPLAGVSETSLLSATGKPKESVGTTGEKRACAPRAVVVLVRQRDGTRYVLPDAPVVLGRSRTCDITIAGNGALSRRHARLDPVALTLADLGSANGTFVDGARLAPQVSTPLAIGAMFTLANEGFRIVARWP